MKKIILLTLIVAAAFTGCQKEETLVRNGQTEIQTTTKIAYENPFEWVGEDHNLSLDYLAAHADVTSLDEQTRIEFIGEYFAIKYPEVEFFTAEEMSEFLNEYVVPGENIEECAVQYFEAGVMNEIQLNYFIRLNEIAMVENIDDFNKYIHELETDLAEEEGLEDPDKEWIWGSVAVCKHSRNYWNDARELEDHPWHSTVAPPDDDYTGTWVGEAWADTCGYIRGFFRKKGYHSRWHNASNGGSNTTAQYVDVNTPQP